LFSAELLPELGEYVVLNDKVDVHIYANF